MRKGKGAADGVGAVVKQGADALTAYGHEIQSAEDLAGLLKKKLPNVKVPL